MKKLIIAAVACVLIAACGTANEDKDKPAFSASSTTTSTASPGKRVFMSNCATCHRLNADMTGPMLAGVIGRWQNDTAKMITYVKNPAQMIATDGPKSYIGQLFTKWHNVSMTSFTNLSDEDIMQVLHYVDKGVE